jgi:hypothetical protein
MAEEGRRDEVLDTLRQVANIQSRLVAAVDAINERVGLPSLGSGLSAPLQSTPRDTESQNDASALMTSSNEVVRTDMNEDKGALEAPAPASPTSRPALTSRIVLTLVHSSLHMTVDLSMVGHIQNRLVSIHFP